MVVVVVAVVLLLLLFLLLFFFLLDFDEPLQASVEAAPPPGLATLQWIWIIKSWLSVQLH